MENPIGERGQRPRNAIRSHSKLRVAVDLDTPPVFGDALQIDGFRMGVIVMFPDLEKQSAKTEAVYSDIMSLKGKVEPFPVEFQIPAGAKSFLVFARIDGCGNGELNGNLAAKGMRMVEAGKVISYLCPT
jgi:hypothetical protein